MLPAPQLDPHRGRRGGAPDERGYGNHGDCRLDLLVDISNVVSPLPLDLVWSSWATTSQPMRSKSYLNMRTYTIRACCDAQTRLHAYFIGVYEKRDCERQLPLSDLRNFCSILNNARILQDLPREHGTCGSPFSAATQYDHNPEGDDSLINGLCFHCHCRQPFSLECWQGATAASAKILSVAKGITSAKEKKANKQ
ncbi:nuclear protein UL55 [Equid alphaherpesvirus 3]|uniref:Nuclear protein UL55 n=1 Tax=Equid alphaherpesvirus 3 TaxID=80341 RepID=A0A077B9M8_9ALPH|nr:nuclear protein UL55 [Equid alphaherpesvirus 3]AIL02921.1 nuclear protein UL55 [Equid alphaherpesvirus 3]